MKKLLLELQKTKLIKVTGSYADNTQNENSDIDFYVKPDKPDTEYSNRNMLKIIKILKDFNIKWESTSTGYIHTHNVDYNLPIPIEFSNLFKHRKNRIKVVNIFEVEFKTY